MGAQVRAQRVFISRQPLDEDQGSSLIAFVNLTYLNDVRGGGGGGGGGVQHAIHGRFNTASDADQLNFEESNDEWFYLSVGIFTTYEKQTR